MGDAAESRANAHSDRRHVRDSVLIAGAEALPVSAACTITEVDERNELPVQQLDALNFAHIDASNAERMDAGSCPPLVRFVRNRAARACRVVWRTCSGAFVEGVSRLGFDLALAIEKRQSGHQHGDRS